MTMPFRTITRDFLYWIAAAFLFLFWLTPDSHAASCLSAYTAGGRTYYILDTANAVPNCAATGGVHFSVADYNTINSNFTTLTNNLAAAVAVNSTQQVSINSLNASVASINSQLAISQTTQQDFANSLAATNAQVASLTTAQAVLSAPFDLATALAAFVFSFRRRCSSTRLRALRAQSWRRSGSPSVMGKGFGEVPRKRHGASVHLCKEMQNEVRSNVVAVCIVAVGLLGFCRAA